MGCGYGSMQTTEVRADDDVVEVVQSDRGTVMAVPVL